MGLGEGGRKRAAAMLVPRRPPILQLTPVRTLLEAYRDYKRHVLYFLAPHIYFQRFGEHSPSHLDSKRW